MSPLWLSLACQGPQHASALEIQADDEVVTRLHVRWTTASPSIDRVEFGEGDFALTTPWESEAGTEHEAVLLGLPSQAQVQLRVASRLEGEDGTTLHSEPYEAETGVLPPGIPVLEFSGEPHEGYTLTTVNGIQDHSVLVLDGQGRVVWYDDAFEGELGAFSVEPSPDGRSLIHMAPGRLRQVPLDGSERVEVDLEAFGGHHDFAVRDAQHLAYLGEVEGVGEDLDGLIGDTLVEIDEAGEHRVIWSVFENIRDLQIHPDEFEGVGQDGLEFSHGNALTYDPGEHLYLLSLAGLRRVVAVDPDTGRTVWLLHLEGQVGLDFEPDHDIVLAHDIGLREGGIHLFANHLADDDCSRVIDLEIDAQAQRAVWADSYGGQSCRSVFALGSAHDTPDGGLLVSWSTEGVLERVDSEGRSTSLTTLGLGDVFGYSRHLDALTP